MKLFSSILVSIFLFGISCKSDSKADQDGPKAVFMEWQKLIDANEFLKAERLSTPATILWIKEIEEIDVDDSTFANNETTQILNLDCIIQNDTATCDYQIMEEGENLQSAIQLVKVNGAWLVDIHDDPSDEELNEE